MPRRSRKKTKTRKKKVESDSDVSLTSEEDSISFSEESSAEQVVIEEKDAIEEDDYDESNNSESVDEEDDDGASTDLDNDQCLYKLTRTAIERNDDLYESTTVAAPIDDEQRYVPEDERICKPFLTTFERVRLLMDRTVQIASGSAIFIKNKKGSIPLKDMDSKTIAQLEIESGKIPLYIERPLPNGKFEKWYVHELDNSSRKYIKKYMVDKKPTITIQ